MRRYCTRDWYLVFLVRLSEFSAKVYPFTSFFGKGMPALFQDAVMFSKNGSKEVTIPEELLKKGTPVLISGYFRPNNNTKDGVTYTGTDLVVTSCDPLAEEAEDAA